MLRLWSFKIRTRGYVSTSREKRSLMPDSDLDSFRIETERLILRLLRPDDLDDLCVLFGDPEVMQYIGAGRVWSRDELAERIEAGRSLHLEHGMSFWGVELRSTGELIGQCGLVPIERKGPEIEVGYRLGKRFWGMGYASEGAMASVEYGFEAIGLERIIAVAHPENVVSHRVLEKVGLRRVGPTDRYYSQTTILFEVERDD